MKINRPFDKRKLEREFEGVSEVVGTILVLAITVVLFSSIFATVSTLESPDRTQYVEMESTFTAVEDHVTVELEHKGGNRLDTRDMRIYFFVTTIDMDSSYGYRFHEDEVTVDGDQDVWDIGETTTVDVTDLPEKTNGEWDWDNPEEVEAFEVLVWDRNRAIFRDEIEIVQPIARPFIKSAGVDYARDWEVYVEAGKTVRALYANLGDPEGDVSDLTVLVDLSPLDGYEYSGWNNTGYHVMEHRRGDRFEIRDLEIDMRQENGTYHLRIRAHDGDDTATDKLTQGEYVEGVRYARPTDISLNVGPVGEFEDAPNIVVEIEEFIPVNPSNRDSLTVRASVQNLGGSRANMNITFWDNETDPDGPVGLIENLHVAAGGGRDVSATWRVLGSGFHNISVEALDISSPGGDDPTPESNRDWDDIFVNPTILLVDDTHEDEGSDARAMKSALDALDLSFQYTTSPPELGGGRYPLEDQDVVIWMTGRTRGIGTGVEERRTLTSDDREDLGRFLDEDDPDYPGAGYLWLIGEGIPRDASVNNWEGWLADNLGVSVEDTDAGAPNDVIYGVDTPFEGDEEYSLRDGDWRGGHVSSTGDGTLALTDGEPENGDGLGVSWEGDESRTMFNSYMFRSMRSGGRAMMTSTVLRWLANVTRRYGNDLAVIDQEIETHSPMYQQEIEISGTIFNNGIDDLGNVEVILKVNGEYLRETRKYVDIASGETIDVTFNWTAEPVGEHDILIVVDPYNRVEETSLENNDIRYQDEDYTVNVRFSVMVVNARTDDGTYMEDSLDRLGYAYDVYDWEDQQGIIDNIYRYNSLYWDSGSRDDSIPGEILDSIEEYLGETVGTSFLMTGDHVLNRTALEDPSFVTDIMGIDDGSIDRVSIAPHEIRGVRNDELAHGMEYRVSGEPNTHDSFQVQDAHEAIYTYHDGDRDSLIGSRFEYEESYTAALGMDLAHFEGPVYEDEWYDEFHDDIDTGPEPVRQEFIYMVTDWFGNVDERVELKVSSVDIELENIKPMLSDSYLLSASIQNLGHSSSEALVRFKDGTSQIASESMFVPAGGSASAEVTWRPLFAGSNRPIRVIVDPRGSVEEIGDEDGDHMGFNNHGMIRNPVYYFWDDMENGTANWDTEATIMNINAENPLEYLSEEYETVYTDIIHEWDDDMSHNVTKTDQFSFSDPYSYHMAEPKPTDVKERIPVDIGIMIDTTGSMEMWSGRYDENGDPISWMDEAIEAAKSLIDMFEDEDRAALFELNTDAYGNPPDSFLVEEFTDMDVDGRNHFKSVLDGWSEGGGTPLWDACGETIEYVHENARSSAQPAAILMTDGVDEIWSNDYIEVGSSNFAPGSPAEPGYGPDDHTWGVDGGHLWEDGYLDYGDRKIYYPNVHLHPASILTVYDDYREYPAGITQETVNEHSLDDSNRRSLMGAPVLTHSVALGVRPTAYLDPGAPGYMSENDPYYPFTSEYHMKLIAENSEGEGAFHYAPTSHELEDIFIEIFEEIAEQAAEAGNITSIGENEINENDSSKSIHSEDETITDLLHHEYFQYGEMDDQYWPPFNWDVSDWGTWEQTTVDGRVSSHTARHGTSGNGWLVSPEIDATQHSALRLEFYDARPSWTSADAELWVSTGSGEPGHDDFEYVEGWELNNAWTHRDIDLSDFDGETLYIAFRYGEGTGDWYLDGVSITAQTSPPVEEGELVDNGIFVDGYEPWELTRLEDQGDSGWDEESYQQGGSIFVSAYSDGDGVVEEEAYWHQDIGPTTNEVTINAAFRKYLAEDGDPGRSDIHTATVELRIRDDGDWFTVYQDTSTALGDGGWVEFGPDVTYDPGGTEIDAVRAYMHLNVEGEHHPQHPGIADGQLWMDEISVFVGEDDDDDDDDEEEKDPIYGQNENKTAVTPAFNLEGYEEARLTMRSKYRMVSGTNGGFVMVGIQVDDDDPLRDELLWVDEDGWAWKYAVPSESTYTSNLNMSVERRDSFGNKIDFAWSGTSGGGSFDWDRVRLNILRYVEDGYEDNVRLMFNYTQYGGGTGFGWYLDDVRVIVSRGNNPIMEHHRDVWRQDTVEGRDGSDTTAWINAHPDAFDDENKYFMSGIDNSLITNSIDLTNARTAYMSAYFKFNINTASGAPPDGFRVEVTTDNGRTWSAINLGVRSAWGVSGTGGEDSYEGADAGNGWTTADSLTRLDTDLSDFRGEVIRIRIRMVTTNAAVYEHYAEAGEPPGFYVDDFVVSGSSVIED